MPLLSEGFWQVLGKTFGWLTEEGGYAATAKRLKLARLHKEARALLKAREFDRLRVVVDELERVSKEP